MQFKNVFKSSKGALKKEKKKMELFDITLCLVTLSSEQSGSDRKQTSSQSMVIFLKSFYKKKSIWFHLYFNRHLKSALYSHIMIILTLNLVGWKPGSPFVIQQHWSKIQFQRIDWKTWTKFHFASSDLF